MKLSIGIVGLPNVGKSTLFKILTKKDILIANYPFATIDPNVGVVAVPDERLQKLSDLSHSAKIVPAIVEFYDIAGLVKGAYKGEGLGNQFLTHIRETDAICEVIRCFESPDIIHIEEKVDPIRDLEIINTELILKDLDTVEKRLAKLEGEARTGDKQKKKDLEIVKKIKEGLDKNLLARDVIASEAKQSTESIEDAAIIKELNLLTIKPQIYLLNGSPEDVSEELKNKIKELGGDFVIIDLANIESAKPRSDSPAGESTTGVDELIEKAYEILGLISFITTGEEETRAWTIRKGAKAPEAAGEIHSDFEKKFIRTEAINWQKLLEAGGWNQAKQKGWIRTEGKDYIMQDGDVAIIRHS